MQYVRLAGDNGRGEVLGHMSAEDILATSSSITSPSPLSKAGFSKGDAAAELMKNADESFGLMEGGSSTGFVKKSKSCVVAI